MVSLGRRRSLTYLVFIWESFIHKYLLCWKLACSTRPWKNTILRTTPKDGFDLSTKYRKSVTGFDQRWSERYQRFYCWTFSGFLRLLDTLLEHMISTLFLNIDGMIVLWCFMGRSIFLRRSWGWISCFFRLWDQHPVSAFFQQCTSGVCSNFEAVERIKAICIHLQGKSSAGNPGKNRWWHDGPI